MGGVDGSNVTQTKANATLHCPECLRPDPGGVERVRAGPDQLPEQVPPDPRLGRPLQQGQGAHQQRLRHEAVPVLQGKCSSLHIVCI